MTTDIYAYGECVWRLQTLLQQNKIKFSGKQSALSLETLY